MLIGDWMSKKAIVAEMGTPIMTASHIMKSAGIRYLPVVDNDGRLAGVVTDRDLKAAAPSKATSLDVFELNYLLANVKLCEIMTRNVVTVKAGETVELAAVLMLDNKISGLPVVDDDSRVTGVITQTDIFRALVSITGANHDGVQFAFSLEDRPGSLKEVADDLRAMGARIISVLTHYPSEGEKNREVYFRIRRVDKDEVEKMRRALGSKFTLISVAEDFTGEVRRRKKR
ncbi:MAG: CBS domain-containing protein [Nitrospinae bacterium]|nr:CBS domain-containing protein [Nitrospinota bacterium]